LVQSPRRLYSLLAGEKELGNLRKKEQPDYRKLKYAGAMAEGQ